MTKNLSEYKPENQKNVVDGIPIDPILREEFEMKEHSLRNSEEINDWWDKPYVTTELWEDRFESYEEHVSRSENNTLFTVNETREEYDSRMADEETEWLNTYPTGVRYTVRCLDGGAWDRSTRKGNFSSLDEALKMAKKTRK